MTDKGKELIHQLRLEEMMTAAEGIHMERVREGLFRSAGKATAEQMEAAITIAAKGWGNMDRAEFERQFLTPLSGPDEQRSHSPEDSSFLKQQALQQVNLRLEQLQRIEARTGVSPKRAAAIHAEDKERYDVLAHPRFPKVVPPQDPNDAASIGTHLNADPEYLIAAPADRLRNLIRAHDFMEGHRLDGITTIRELVEMPPAVAEELFRARPVPGEYKAPRCLADNLALMYMNFTPLVQASPEQVRNIAEGIHLFFSPPEGMRVPYDPQHPDPDAEIRQQFAAVFQANGITLADIQPSPTTLSTVGFFLKSARAGRGCREDL